VTLNEREADMMAEVREAMRADEVRFTLTWAWFAPNASPIGDGLRIEYRSYGQRAWKKVKTAIFPGEGEDAAHVLRMLLDIRAEVRGE
jgi:hypothetical protein